MKRKFLLTLLFVVFTIAFSMVVAQTSSLIIEGSWLGVLKVQGTQHDIDKNNF